MIEFLIGVAVGTMLVLFNLGFLLYYWNKEDKITDDANNSDN